MGKKRKSYKEKLMILREAEVEGVLQTCRKYDVHPATYYNWKEKYEEGGIEALKSKKRNSIDPEIKRLRGENERLKKLLAEKELALEIKEELLKKVLQREKRK
jgi:putative transposase